MIVCPTSRRSGTACGPRASRAAARSRPGRAPRRPRRACTRVPLRRGRPAPGGRAVGAGRCRGRDRPARRPRRLERDRISALHGQGGRVLAREARVQLPGFAAAPAGRAARSPRSRASSPCSSIQVRATTSGGCGRGERYRRGLEPGGQHGHLCGARAASQVRRSASSTIVPSAASSGSSPASVIAASSPYSSRAVSRSSSSGSRCTSRSVMASQSASPRAAAARRSPLAPPPTDSATSAPSSPQRGRNRRRAAASRGELVDHAGRASSGAPRRRSPADDPQEVVGQPVDELRRRLRQRASARGGAAARGQVALGDRARAASRASRAAAPGARVPARGRTRPSPRSARASSRSIARQVASVERRSRAADEAPDPLGREVRVLDDRRGRARARAVARVARQVRRAGVAEQDQRLLLDVRGAGVDLHLGRLREALGAVLAVDAAQTGPQRGRAGRPDEPVAVVHRLQDPRSARAPSARPPRAGTRSSRRRRRRRTPAARWGRSASQSCPGRVHSCTSQPSLSSASPSIRAIAVLPISGGPVSTAKRCRSSV